MSGKLTLPPPSQVLHAKLNREADEVIAALRALGRRVSNLVILESLESACFEIASAASAPQSWPDDPLDDEDDFCP